MTYFIVSVVANIVSWFAGRPYAIIHDPWFEIPYTLVILGVPIFLLWYFARRKILGKIAGWSCFAFGLLILFFGIFSFLIFWIAIGIVLIGIGLWLGIRKPKPKKQLICPNGCQAVQQGTNYCGLCGTRLVWK